MKLVALSKNSYTKDTHFIVDDEDFHRTSIHKWYVSASNRKFKSPQYRIMREAKKEEVRAGSTKKISVHRFILNIHLKYNDGLKEVDHINRNTFDNRKDNLRIVSRSVNQRNKINNTKAGIGLWGATFNKGIRFKKQWQANFHSKGKTYMIGYFETEIEAHESAIKAYEEIMGRKPNF